MGLFFSFLSTPSYVHCRSPALRMQEERVLHEAKLAKMEAEMKMVFQQKVQEKEAKLKQSEEELYARHREMKESLEKQRLDLEEKKRKIEAGRPLTPEKGTVRDILVSPIRRRVTPIVSAAENKEGFPSSLKGRAGLVILSARKVHCHPCNPFHGVSIAISATLSNSSILHSPLYSLSIVSRLLVRLTLVTLLCTDIHGMFRHSFV